MSIKKVFLATISYMILYDASGQSFARLETANKKYDGYTTNYLIKKKKHNATTNVGKIIFTAGGIAVAAGITGMVTPIAKNYDDLYGDSYKNFTNVLVAGASFAICGALIYRIGREDENQHKDKKISFSIGGRQLIVSVSF